MFFFTADAELLVISMTNVSEGGQSHLRVRISCQSMDLAAELVQDIAKYFQLEELESEADFPAELQAFEEVVRRVADCNAARVSLAADMADDSQRIKVSRLSVFLYLFVVVLCSHPTVSFCFFRLW